MRISCNISFFIMVDISGAKEKAAGVGQAVKEAADEAKPIGEGAKEKAAAVGEGAAEKSAAVGEGKPQ